MHWLSNVSENEDYQTYLFKTLLVFAPIFTEIEKFTVLNFSKKCLSYKFHLKYFYNKHFSIEIRNFLEF